MKKKIYKYNGNFIAHFIPFDQYEFCKKEKNNKRISNKLRTIIKQISRYNS